MDMPTLRFSLFGHINKLWKTHKCVMRVQAKNSEKLYTFVACTKYVILFAPFPYFGYFLCIICMDTNIYISGIIFMNARTLSQYIIVYF